MLRVEYLLFNNKKDYQCKDKDSFEYFIQSNTDIKIIKNKIKFRKNHTFDYKITVKNISNTEEISFHIDISTNDLSVSSIEHFVILQKELKRLFSVFNTSPQVLYDGLSQYFASRAYPKIFEIENLMRKLITKFMLINVGTNWIDTNTPDDVKESIRDSNKEPTYLHNIDFIKLSDFLFSDKFNSSKDDLINKIRSITQNDDVQVDKKYIEELKDYLPISNWEKFFSNEIDMSQEKLKNKWEQLYKLRNKVAHNKSFTKSDLEDTEKLINDLKPALDQAIQKLDHITINSEAKMNLEMSIIGSLNPKYVEFLQVWHGIELLIDNYLLKHNISISTKYPFHRKIRLLKSHDKGFERYYGKLTQLASVRNKIVHFEDSEYISNIPLDDIIFEAKEIYMDLKTNIKTQ